MDLRVQTSYRQIFSIALPISLSLLVPQINFITNNVFLGALGEEELASAGITGVYYLTFAVIGNGLNNGLQALIARRAGQNLPSEIGKLFINGGWVALGLAAVGILITYVFAPPLIESVLYNPRIKEAVIDFIFIRIWGLPFFYLYIMRNALLVGTQNTRFLVWGTLSEAVVNIILDYGLIYGKFGLPELGFNGAAYASICAEFTGLLVIYLIIYQKGFHRQFSFSGQRLDLKICRLIFVQSAPLMAQYGLSIATWEYFYILIEHLGERALAVSNAMRNLIGIFGITCWAFASTTNTMVSNLIGQNRHDEVLQLIKKVTLASFGVSLIFFIFINLKPNVFLSIFGQDTAFIDYGIPVVRTVSIALLIMSVGTIWLNAVIGTGNTKVNLGIEIVTLFIYIIYVYLVLHQWQLGLTWGWISEWVYWISMFSMAYLYMRSGRWRTKVI